MIILSMLKEKISVVGKTRYLQIIVLQETQNFSKFMYLHVDTVRNQKIVKTLISIKQAICLVGQTGTGKTVLSEKMLENLHDSHSALIVNFSSATTSNGCQEIIEGFHGETIEGQVWTTRWKTISLFC